MSLLWQEHNFTCVAYPQRKFLCLKEDESHLSLKSIFVTAFTVCLLHDLSSAWSNRSHEHAAARTAAEWDDETNLGNKEHSESLAIFKPAVTLCIIWVFLQLAYNAWGAEDSKSCECDSANVDYSSDIKAASGGSEQGEFEETQEAEESNSWHDGVEPCVKVEDHSPFGIDQYAGLGLRDIQASIVFQVIEGGVIHVFNHPVVRICMTKEIPVAHHECTSDD